MKIAVLMGNPRKNGYTQYLADLFVKGLLAGGADVDIIDLTAVKINHCLGCYHCWLVTPGVCVHRDDMVSVMARFSTADCAVIVSPLNSYAVTSYVKSFMDRTFTFTKEGFSETPRGLLRNSVRHPDHWPKSMAGIFVGAFRGSENFEGVKKSLELLIDGLSLKQAGIIIRPESYLLQFTFAKPKTIKIIETAFEQAGRELAATGHIYPETAEKAASTLASDNAHFLKYSNIFWEHAAAIGPDALDLRRVGARVVTDMRVLLSEMVRSVDTVATARIKAIIQFDFTDSSQHYSVSMDRGKADVSETDAENCDLRVTTTTLVWSGIFMRTINARDALVDKRIVLAGDKSLFSRLDRFFPPPST
jgi:multimeric flavodoxin WrbA